MENYMDGSGRIIMTHRVLIVEDDNEINQLLAKIMKKQGYNVVQAFSGTEADLRLFASIDSKSNVENFNIILLDLMLPGMKGEDLLEKIRAISDIPVIILSAKSALEDKVSLLNNGADDYITKPFEIEEVIARVNGAIKRYEKYHKVIIDTVEEDSSDDNCITYKKINLYKDSREVTFNGEALELTVYEYELLKLFIENPNKVFSRESLYEIIWNGDFYGEDNTVNMHISNLRKKISKVADEEYIKTVWGIGYKVV